MSVHSQTVPNDFLTIPCKVARGKLSEIDRGEGDVDVVDGRWTPPCPCIALAGSGDAPYFHMGGDEVHLGCWNSSRQVVDYLSRALARPKRRKEDFIALWGHFQDRATQALDRAQLHLAEPT